MITCRLIKTGGGSITLPAVLEWTFSYGTGLPCDSFYLRCLWDRGKEKELSGFALFEADWNGERVFTGVIDEYTCQCDKDGLCLEVSGRGMAARLLDNEAVSIQYQQATCADIIANHVTPYGVTVAGTPSLPAVSGFSVSSGVSEWSVLYDFACCHGGIVPRFDQMGRLVLEPHHDGTPLEIGDLAPVTEWRYREQRYGVLSHVAVRQRSTWNIRWAENSEFLATGGCARRVVTVPYEIGSTGMRYTADYQLKASQAEQARLTMTLAGAFHAWPGQLVEVRRGNFGGNGLYRVARTEVSCSGDGLSTLLELGEPDSMI